jgi:hypothetical protein
MAANENISTCPHTCVFNPTDPDRASRHNPGTTSADPISDDNSPTGYKGRSRINRAENIDISRRLDGEALPDRPLDHDLPIEFEIPCIEIHITFDDKGIYHIDLA